MLFERLITELDSEKSLLASKISRSFFVRPLLEHFGSNGWTEQSNFGIWSEQFSVKPVWRVAGCQKTNPLKSSLWIQRQHLAPKGKHLGEYLPTRILSKDSPRSHSKVSGAFEEFTSNRSLWTVSIEQIPWNGCRRTVSFKQISLNSLHWTDPFELSTCSKREAFSSISKHRNCLQSDWKAN